MEPRQQRNWPPSAKETAIKTDDVFDDDAQIELGEPAVAMNEDDETERPMEPQDMGRVVRKFGQVRRLVVHVAAKSWADSIFMRSAAAAFWQMLSLAPLLLVLLGSLGYVGHWFGPDTVAVVESKIITFSRKLISPSVGDDLVAPTVADVLQPGHGGVLSIGFVLSLWAGSSAIAAFVDAITAAHGQASARHPVWQRIFALLLCIGFLIAAVLILPVVALGPSLAGRVLPVEWREPGLRLIDIFYYPGTGLLLIVALTTLYKLALQHTLRWRRLFGGALVAGVFFMAASEGLRRYLSWTAQASTSVTAPWQRPSPSCSSISSSASRSSSGRSSTRASRSSGLLPRLAGRIR